MCVMFAAKLLLKLVTWNNTSWYMQEQGITCVMFVARLFLSLVVLDGTSWSTPDRRVTPHKRVSALHHSDITCPGNKCGHVYHERPHCSLLTVFIFLQNCFLVKMLSFSCYQMIQSWGYMYQFADVNLFTASWRPGLSWQK
jgi:hypothetical protein